MAEQLQMQRLRGHATAPGRRRRRHSPGQWASIGPRWLWVVVVVVLARGSVAEDNNTHEDEPSNVLLCPTTSSRPLFTLPCKSDEDCKILGEQCCNLDGKFRCMKGVPKPKPEPIHLPFLGIIPRECPKYPVPERLAIKNCTADNECWPRICCPDGFQNYCRTPLPKWQETPRLSGTFKDLVAYMQCTAPPPPLLDLFPKPCKSVLDCFPNLCCQERDKKVCRPPKKSMLALIAMVTQRIGSG